MAQKSKNYEILMKIGQGSFGTVFKVRRRFDRQIFVMKQIKIQSLSKKHQQESLHEVTILSSLSCPYIVKYFDSFVENSTLHIVMEYCEKGDLSQILKKKSLPESKVWKYFTQACIGLEYLHSKQILHRDIKTLNIFLGNDDSVRIGDMGVAKILNNQAAFAETQVGSPYYLSPELCEEKPYNTKSDVWALGCVLYEMCTGKHPFNAPNKAALLLKIVRGEYLPLTAEFSTGLREIVNECLERDYKRRPSVQGILLRNDVKLKVNEFKLYVPNGSVLYKKQMKENEEEEHGTIIAEKPQRFNVYSPVPIMKIVEEAQNKVCEVRRSSPEGDFRMQRPFSANKPEIFSNLHRNPYSDVQKKDFSPLKFIAKLEDVLNKNHSDKKKRELIEEQILEKKIEKEIPHIKKRSQPDLPDKSPVRDISNVFIPQFPASIRQNQISSKSGERKTSISDFPKKILDRDRFRINLKSRNQPTHPVDQQFLYKQKIPSSAKVPTLDYTNDEIKMVQNLPEIPKQKSKLTVKMLKDGSPIRNIFPHSEVFSLRPMRKPILEPVFNAIDKSRLNAKSKSFESASKVLARKIITSPDHDEVTFLKNKEQESVKTEANLRQQCAELRSDIVGMIGEPIFKEMHKIFTNIITVCDI
jgi:NIMA (never in mitosis gene a)-related kinase 1/4/5